jgi:type II secretory pathway component PulC
VTIAPTAPTVIVGEPPAAPPPPPTAPSPPPGERFAVARAELDAVLLDFDRLAREIQIEAAPGGGVRVTAIAPGSLFHRAGVRKGDIVRRIAGEAITDIGSAARIYARVQASDEFVVELDRGGARHRYTYRLH